MPITLITRVERHDNIWTEETLFDHHETLFERKLAFSASHLPVSAREQILWDENKNLRGLAKILQSLNENSKVTLDDNTDLDSRDVLPALKGIKAACKAVDDIAAGKKQHAVCASVAMQNSDHHEEQDLAFSVFSSAAIAAHYALTKPKLKKVAVIDFEVNHGGSPKKLIENNPNILLITVNVGSSQHHQTLIHNNESIDAAASGHVLDVALPAIIHPQDLSELFYSKIIKPIQSFEADVLILTLQPHNFEQNWPNELTPEIVNAMCWDAAQKFTKGKFICILEGIENEDVIGGFLAN